MSKSELCVSCENFDAAVVFHATQKSAVSSLSHSSFLHFIFFFSFFPSLARKHAPQFFRAALFFLSLSPLSLPTFLSHNDIAFRLRDIDSPLLNSIRHDTSLFLEVFRHHDRFPECRSRCRFSCLKVAFLRTTRDTAVCAHSMYTGQRTRRRLLPFSRWRKYSRMRARGRTRHGLRSLSSLAN